MENKTDGDRLLTVPFALLCTGVFATYTGFYVMLPAMPLFILDLGGTETQSGLLMGLLSFTALVVRPFGGWMIDNWGRKRVILAGLVVMTASCLAYIGVGTVSHLLWLRILHGIGWGAVTASAATLAADLAPAHRRGESLGVFTAAGSLAFVVGPALSVFLGNRSYSTIFTLAAVTQVVGLGLIAALREPSRSHLQKRPLRLSGLVSRPVLGPAAILLSVMLTYGSIISFVPLAARERGVEPAAAYFTIYAIALLLCRQIAGRLSDSHGRVRIIGMGLVAVALAMVILAEADHLILFGISAVLYAVGVAAVQPPALAWAIDRVERDSYSVGMSTIIAAQDMGISLGSMLGGFAVKMVGYEGMYLGSAMMTAGGWVALGWMRKQESRKGGAGDVGTDHSG